MQKKKFNSLTFQPQQSLSQRLNRNTHKQLNGILVYVCCVVNQPSGKTLLGLKQLFCVFIFTEIMQEEGDLKCNVEIRKSIQKKGVCSGEKSSFADDVTVCLSATTRYCVSDSSAETQWCPILLQSVSQPVTSSVLRSIGTCVQLPSEYFEPCYFHFLNSISWLFDFQFQFNNIYFHFTKIITDIIQSKELH